MSRCSVQEFIDHNQSLTDKTIDPEVVKALLDIKTVEQCLRSDIFKDSSKSKLIYAFNAARQQNKHVHWMTRGNKQSLTINATETKDKLGINYGFPPNYMLDYLLEPSGHLYLQPHLKNLKGMMQYGHTANVGEFTIHT